MSCQIIGLGGGGFSAEDNHLLDLYIVGSAGKKNPRICLLATASGDNVGFIQYFKKVFSQYPCDPFYLSLMSPGICNMKEFLLSMDIIYVGGGNSKSMLGLWKEWGIDKALIEAYEKGIVLAGVSAGFVCWFEQCITDSFPGKLSVMDCLGLLKGSGSPHYGSIERQDAYHEFLKNGSVKEGYAADDCAGLHFVDGKLLRVVSSRPDAKAYRLFLDQDSKESMQETIETEFLGAEENYKKHIYPIIAHLYEQEETEGTSLEEELDDSDILES